MDKIYEIFKVAANSAILQLLVVSVILDTIFGVLRAIKEHKFNSCIGINGAIRKISMMISIIFLVLVDNIVNLNLIGFIPEEARTYIGLKTVGTMEFFAILYIAYEIVSTLKNMTLCGLPVKKVWNAVRKALGKYTDELPDTDGLEEDEKRDDQRKGTVSD